ncbi:putative Sphinganine-1-phosphate aldolase BST1 [Taphrina deformans PYCC 5710]|uniref:sphinganine-1-phosphate aldolase n=1 Tax=Taphrina deformans (strain PYCC 5710 / ATCC 11124 / CBS 356.35 / IMI 108563 / JCM 9778 / NBRC 8474) TaxID=1097556 RepID=R4X8Z7_TAPDE|nr:putative Sphinganine-1-phosphate aldolase BST1 [Taphrina deformans PYCC 5710]|eukprot:CCG80622.1 putative Sphinganine-1-phosphate aldolase BST1 [Taphrina deformans PYCC 5710]
MQTLTKVKRSYKKYAGQIQTIRNIYTLYIIIKNLLLLSDHIRLYGASGTASQFYSFVKRVAFKAFVSTPGIKGKVQKQVKDALAGLDEKMLPKAGTIRYQNLPTKGMSKDQLQIELKKLHDMGGETDWESGKVSGAIYHGGKDMGELLSSAYSLFSLSNPLHPDVFPGVRKMEAEVVQMVLNMFHAPTNGGGTTTSGGTESILMACKAARERGRIEKGITKPEMIVPITVHAAFDKAASYFGITLHHIKVDPITFQVDLSSVERLINKNTVLLAGSAPNFPHGVIDDITSLSALGLRNDIPVHVDACLGSFLVPFLEKAGFETPLFDFRLPGVTSISCDTHKYGFAPKGSSVIMYRDRSLRKYQYFVSTDWPGGVYASPSIAGSRPGAIIAGCWTAMMNMGQDGYIASCKEIVGARVKIQNRIENEIPELRIIGRPLVSVVAFDSPVVNIYTVGDKMSKLGWHLNGLQTPPALHIACTKLTVNAVDTLIADLKSCVKQVQEEGGGGDAGSMGKQLPYVQTCN